MRGRPPRLIGLKRHDKKVLEALAHSGGVVQRMARRARALLAMARGRPIVRVVARQVQMTRHALWYLCRRYEKRGLEAVRDAPRSGRPRQFPPLGASADRASGLL